MNREVVNREECPECHGIGKIQAGNCGSCEGSGHIIVHSHVHQHGDTEHDHPHSHPDAHDPEDDTEHEHRHE